MKHGDKGIIFNIQRFCTNDGPGIRTLVFLKGCPLRCAWCANPESQDPRPQLMIRRDLCIGCGTCETACPHEAISRAEDGRMKIAWSSCTQCFACVETCPAKALEKIGRYLTVYEVTSKVLEDSLFQDNSCGGVTISGGEPLFQSDFLCALLEDLKKHCRHIALETSGYAPRDRLSRVLPYTDLILFDIKCLDPVKHKYFTGVDNAIILENAFAAAAVVPTWIRIPLMSGVNDSEEEIRSIARIAQEGRFVGMNLLPYHDGGSRKRSQLGLVANRDSFHAPHEDAISRLQEIALSYDLSCTVGG